MVGGTQAIEAVIEHARTLAGAFDAAFDVPVLVIEGEEDADWEDSTEVTSPTAPLPAPKAATEQTGPGLVIPLQARFPTPGAIQLSFGRSTVCDVVLPFASVSKHHGYFSCEAGQWYVSDVGSRNGTFLGSAKVGQQRAVVTDGQTLEIGKIAVRFLSVQGFHQLLRYRLGIDVR